MTTARNVLMVSFDCARADVLYSLDVPTITALRSSGITCRSAISPAPLTPVSHASVFTGQHPHRHGLRHLLEAPLAAKPMRLAERFRAAGYQTTAFVACAALDRWYGLDRGFDTYDDRPAGDGRPIRHAEEMAGLCIDWLSRADPGRPWFCFLHFFDAHWPYATAPDGLNPYEVALWQADRALGRVLASVGGRSVDTLVVLFGDHGEDMGGLYANDRGGASLGHPHERGHGTLLYQTTQHVPLILAGADLPTTQFDGLTSLVDIAPTLCRLLALPGPQDFDGRDIVADVIAARHPERLLFAETFYPGDLASDLPSAAALSDFQAAWVDAQTKVMHRLSDGAQWAFDLVADPCERRQLTPPLQIAWPQPSRKQRSRRLPG